MIEISTVIATGRKGSGGRRRKLCSAVGGAQVHTCTEMC